MRAGAHRPALAFSLAQGWPNDLVALAGSSVGDAALGRSADVLMAYRRAGYDAYALLSPQHGDKSKLVRVLDTLKARGIPFVLDVISSDTMTLGNDFGNSPASVPTGMPLWPNGHADHPGGIHYYLQRYPNHFRGMRVMEPELMFKRYQDLGWSMGGVAHWIGQFVAIAAQNRMWVEFSTTSWDCRSSFCESREIADAVKGTVASLARQYPGVIYPTYPTNDGSHVLRLDPRNGLPFWKSLISLWGQRGIGLSAQSWMTGYPNVQNEIQTPVDAILAFIRSGLDGSNGPPVSLIQFEPYWYFFNWTARGAESDGTASANGRAVAASFGVGL